MKLLQCRIHVGLPLRPESFRRLDASSPDERKSKREFIPCCSHLHRIPHHHHINISRKYVSNGFSSRQKQNGILMDFLLFLLHFPTQQYNPCSQCQCLKGNYEEEKLFQPSHIMSNVLSEMAWYDELVVDGVVVWCRFGSRKFGNLPSNTLTSWIQNGLHTDGLLVRNLRTQIQQSPYHHRQLLHPTTSKTHTRQTNTCRKNPNQFQFRLLDLTHSSWHKHDLQEAN